MVKRIKLIILFVTFFITQISYAYLRNKEIRDGKVYEIIEYGEINWTDGYIKITGRAELPIIIKNKSDLRIDDNLEYAENLASARRIAFQNAENMAFAKLLAAIHNLRIYDEHFLINYIKKNNPEFNSQLENFIKNYSLIKKIYNPDNSVSVELTLRLWGDNGLFSIFPENDEDFVSFNSTNFKLLVSTNAEFTIIPQEYHSLIIDATGVKEFQPNFFPTIIDEDGRIIYCSSFLSKDKAKKNGIVRYIGDNSLLFNYDFVDDKAFLVKALRIGRTKTEIVIPSYIAPQLFSSTNTFNYLKNCNFIIITK